MAGLSTEKLYFAQKEQQIILAEFNAAATNHPPMNSLHEAWAVIYEEVDELWEQVKLKQRLRNNANVKTELRQIAAMALRALVDLKLD